jgi:hypothetical protein
LSLEREFAFPDAKMAIRRQVSGPLGKNRLLAEAGAMRKVKN